MQPTNFIFILADDLGYADLGCTGARDAIAVTPHLDEMARQGMLFTSGYANSPVCSPTRFALATGRWQYRLRGAAEEPLSKKTSGDKILGLPPEHPTLASLLRDAGYRSALIGKWHLGYPPDFGPRKSGYDYFFGLHSGGVDYFSHADTRGVHDLWENETPAHCDGYMTDLLSRKAVDFIEQQDSSRGFLLNLHYTAPHWPWETRNDRPESRRIGTAIHHLDGGTLATYRQMIREMDQGIGELLRALDARGLARNTLVVFTSDNGGERYSDNWPFIGQKMDLLEGGIRVPLLARWPQRIWPGSVSATPVITMDWVATMLAAAGVQPDPDYPLDGIDLQPLLENPGWRPERDLYWRMKHRSQRALLRKGWKYLSMDGHEYLFDLSADQREKANQAKREPLLLQELREAWVAWNATMPPIPQDAGVSLVYNETLLPRPTY